MYGMTCWVDLKVAHEWPPLLDGLADALELRIRKTMLERGDEVEELMVEHRFERGHLPTETGFTHVVFVTVLVAEVT